MPRPAGARNQDYDEKRAALLDQLTIFALTADLRRPSLRQFALAVEQSEPTLRHYFGDRQGLVIEIIENIGRWITPIWREMARPAQSTQLALDEFFLLVERSLGDGEFARAHAFGLIEGLADEVVGEAYLTKLVEPGLRTIADKLRAAPDGPKSEEGLRTAAIAIFSPLLAINVHQDLLGGVQIAPINKLEVLRRLRHGVARSLQR